MKTFPIPQLNQENWDAIQASLDSIGRIVSELQNAETDGRKKQDMELISIHLGMIDMYLGRHYTLNETMEELKMIGSKNGTEGH